MVEEIKFFRTRGIPTSAFPKVLTLKHLNKLTSEEQDVLIALGFPKLLSIAQSPVSLVERRKKITENKAQLEQE